MYTLIYITNKICCANSNNEKLFENNSLKHSSSAFELWSTKNPVTKDKKILKFRKVYNEHKFIVYHTLKVAFKTNINSD